jgi:hypothetical protein
MAKMIESHLMEKYVQDKIEHEMNNGWFSDLYSDLHRELVEYTIWLRLRKKTEIYTEKFFNIVHENLDELCETTDTRWLVSICDTIADYGKTDLERSNAILISSIVYSIKLMDTVVVTPDYPETNKEKILQHWDQPLWDGMWRFDIHNGNMVENQFARINRVLRSTPYLHKIYQEVLKRALKGPNTFSTLAKIHNRGLLNE